MEAQVSRRRRSRKQGFSLRRLAEHLFAFKVLAENGALLLLLLLVDVRNSDVL